jgi:hypothetical protein
MSAPGPSPRHWRSFPIWTMMTAIALIAVNLAICRILPLALVASIPLAIAAFRTLFVFPFGEQPAFPFDSRRKLFFGTLSAALIAEFAGAIAFASSCTATALTGEMPRSGPSRLVPGLMVGALVGVPVTIYSFLGILRAFRRDEQAREALRFGRRR